MIRAAVRHNFSQRFGTMRELAPIAFPIVLSQAIDVLMIFCDRYFLSQIGKEPLAATLSGGILTFIITSLVTGTLAQINPLVAQYRGAAEEQKCVTVAQQGFAFTVVFAPAVFLLAHLAAPALFATFEHRGDLLENELAYFRILSLTVFTSALRQVFANFFVGIGQTLMVTIASLTAVALNLPLAYALTFGAWGLPRLEISGTAWATVISGVLPLLILCIRFFARDVHARYRSRRAFALDATILRQLVRYGFPAGLETFVNAGGFMFFTMVMYSFSADVAAATTIVLNWDMVSFLPLLGLSQSTSSLVGKYLGARKKRLALRSAWSGLKAGWMYAALVTLLYLTLTRVLVAIFSPGDKQADFSGTIDYAVIMLKISCLYFFFDATYSVLGGILKGAGDTVWTMVASNSLMWTMAAVTYFLKVNGQLSPIGGWLMLTGLILVFGVLFFLRFHGKKWLHRLMIQT